MSGNFTFQSSKKLRFLILLYLSFLSCEIVRSNLSGKYEFMSEGGGGGRSHGISFCPICDPDLRDGVK